MSLFGVGLADAEAQGEPVVEPGVGQVEFAAGVEPVEQALVDVVAAPMAEADQVQGRGRGPFEAGIGFDPAGEFLRQLHVATHVVAQSLHAVVADHEPELEGAEAAAQGDVPVAVVDDGARLGGCVAQVLGEHAQRVDQALAVGHVEAVAVEVGEHPLVRVEAVAVGLLQAGVDPAEFGAQASGAGHGRIHVQPDAVLPADAADGGQGIDSMGGGGAHSGADEAGGQSGLAVLGELAGQGRRAHGELRVDVDQPQVAAAQAGDLDRLFHGGVSLGGGVGHQGAVAPLFVGRQPGGPLAGGQRGAQGGAGGGVLDDAAAAGRRAEGGGQIEHGDHPVEHVGLQFGAGRAGGPEHALHAQASGQEFAQDGRTRDVGREKGEEIGRLPVGDARENLLLHVAEDGGEVFSLFGGIGRQRGADLPGFHLGEHGQGFDALLVLGEPVDHGVAPAAELFGTHVIVRFIGHRKR